MNFTIKELRQGIHGLPENGFFNLNFEEPDKVVYYEFIVDKTFCFADSFYETIDVMVDYEWIPITSLGSPDEINQAIAAGDYERFRYIALVD
jgi:hypothetical protein